MEHMGYSFYDSFKTNLGHDLVETPGRCLVPGGSPVEDHHPSTGEKSMVK
jgi:hypothetical protein